MILEVINLFLLGGNLLLLLWLARELKCSLNACRRSAQFKCSNCGQPGADYTLKPLEGHFCMNCYQKYAASLWHLPGCVTTSGALHPANHPLPTTADPNMATQYAFSLHEIRQEVEAYLLQLNDAFCDIYCAPLSKKAQTEAPGDFACSQIQALSRQGLKVFWGIHRALERLGASDAPATSADRSTSRPSTSAKPPEKSSC